MNNKLRLGILGLALIPGVAKSQISGEAELLTLEQAISYTLSNNYNIKVEQYNVDISENNVSRAISGQMPRVEFTAAYEWGYGDAETQTLGSGEGPAPVQELSGTSNDLSFKNQLTIPIFQGFRGRYRFQQLQNTLSMSELQLNDLVERTISQTVSAYLQVSRLQSELGLDRDNLDISYDRWERKQTEAQFGATNSTRVLQAEVDLKTDSAAYRTTRLELDNAKRDLNQLMVRGEDIDYAVQEDIQLVEDLEYNSLLESMRSGNTQLRFSQRGVENALLESRISQATKMPTLEGYANMSYFNTEDEASFIQSNRVLGPNLGVQLSFPIFTGGANTIQRQNARLRLEQQKTSLENTGMILETELQNAFAQYINHRQQLRIERANLPTFEQNFEKTSQDYRLGLVDENDLRTAQLNLSLARNRINNLKYSVKQSEISLLRLSGQLRTDNQG